jgi:hypothetical protein
MPIPRHSVGPDRRWRGIESGCRVLIGLAGNFMVES